jgi:CubicO group peptidase (beta-lactamase class C family)
MWFSMTKLVTATCVLQLVERRQVDLDDPVTGHYAPFKIRPFKWMESVTERNLLNHASGLANPIPHHLDTRAWSTGTGPGCILKQPR